MVTIPAVNSGCVREGSTSVRQVEGMESSWSGVGVYSEHIPAIYLLYDSLLGCGREWDDNGGREREKKMIRKYKHEKRR